MMKRFAALTVGLALSLTVGAQTAHASSILYFTDNSVSTDRMAQALVAVSGTNTVTTASSIANFTTLLSGGGFDLAIFFLQDSNGAAFDTAFAALAAFYAGGGSTIAADWSLNETHISPFSGSFDLNGVNDLTVTVTASALLPGVTNPVSLFNPGWGIFSTGMTALAGATCAATFSDGECAILLTNDGRAFFNGFLNDTFVDGAEGVNLYVNQINAALAAQQPAAVPEPATIFLLGSGLLVAGRRLRRKKQ